jgi:hypothetical protein
LYAAIAALENLGHAIGDPSLQQIFAATLRLQFPPFWQALPFFVAAVSNLTTFSYQGTYGISGAILLGGGVYLVHKSESRSRNLSRGQIVCKQCADLLSAALYCF